MKIERVDDKTVKCFLSNEELEEYDITYKDFVIRSEKAKEIVEEIIEQAEEEVGYQPPKFAFDLQIMVLPEKGMVLTFSEREPESGDAEFDANKAALIDCLKEMKDMIQEKKKAMYQEGSGDGKGIREAQEAVQKARPEFAVFAFAQLRDVLHFASVLPGNLRIESALYEMDGSYYLYLTRGSASYKRYSRTCVQALEFAGLYAADAAKVEYLQEHAECLIADHAVKKLRLK